MVKDTDYSRILEDVRHIYKQKYDVVMDDELLYIIIRLNEMQGAFNKKIESIPKLTFRSGKDYFFYGLGKSLSVLFVGAGLILLSCFLFFTRENTKKTYKISQSEKGITIQLNSYNAIGDTVLHFPTVKQKTSANNFNTKK
ncbi:MAG: hypothetical protein ACR2KZ_04460 [Segetibacter sp.]